MTPSQYRCVHPVCDAVEHVPFTNGGKDEHHFVVMRCSVCGWCFSVPCTSLGSDICRQLRSVYLKGHTGGIKRRRFVGPPDGSVDVAFEEVIA